MKLALRNCNNIDSADVEIVKNKLNIKYAINGTGKSTIAKAIELSSKGASLDELIPFKYRKKKLEDNQKPLVTGIEHLGSVSVFNEGYIKQFTYKQEELIDNSFEIFVKTPDYDRQMLQIEGLIESIKATFQQSEDLNQVINDLGIFIESFGKAASGYSAAGALAKGLGNGNKVDNIPTGLEEFSDFIRSEKKVTWLGWQIKGVEFSELSANCPFCTSSVETKRERIGKVKEQYDAKAIEHLNNILAVIEKLSRYFNDETNARFRDISHKADKLLQEEIEYLLQVKQQAIIFRDKLTNLKTISYFNLKDVDKIIDLIDSSRIKIEFLPFFQSETSENVIHVISEALDGIAKKASELQGKVNIQKGLIEKAIRDNSSEINAFLENAGYQYTVSIVYESEKYRLKLRHREYDKPIQNGDQHLSFGERNALSIILFMYECISKNVECIILDDPISSFDRNKKYAIIDKLFGKNSGFRNKTVIMLTHDFEPIIDMIYTLRRTYINSVVASFMESTVGVITEIEIKKSDIKTFTQICEENISTSSNALIKLIYLRRYYEIVNNKRLEYELLSNLFHKRSNPFIQLEAAQIPMNREQIEGATEVIAREVPGFEYASFLGQIRDDVQIKALYKASRNSYEKMQLFRTLTAEAIGSSTLRKYINETFHIENDYIMQLNPATFQIIPSFIIDQCDSEIERMT